MDLYEYKEFNEETKLFLNKAMDIYSTIKDSDIKKQVKYLGMTKLHTFTKKDKKILSLYIAGFLIKSELKKILDEYIDVKIEDLLAFINISEEQIKSLETSQYNNFYYENFRLELMNAVEEKTWVYDFNVITPEIIFCSLGSVRVNGSEILNYLGAEYNLLVNCFFTNHPSFAIVKKYAIANKMMREKKFNKDDKETIEQTAKPNETENETVMPVDIESEEIWSILDEIQNKFIGQEKTAEDLFYNIVNNQQLALRDDVNDGERSIIFLDGPTGTGKTAITREITDKLKIPFVSSSVTNYSATGYVGGDITDTLKELYKKANRNIKLAQKGIIVFDEFDKIAYSRIGGLEMKKAVQQQLLDFMGGGKYIINVGHSGITENKIEFDTSKLTFICLGALSELKAIKTTKKPTLGFRDSSESTETIVDNYSITPQDLIGIGLERELVGRLNTYLHTEEYSKENLLRILKESTISPLIAFEKWIISKGKKLEIDDSVYEIIADAAYNLNTGARSLQTVMNNIRTHFLKKVLRGKEEVIYLDPETIIDINEYTINRRVRR